MSITFDKYQKHGAYHWRDTEIKRPLDLLRFSLALWTRYQIILQNVDPGAMTKGVEIGCGDGLLSWLMSKKGVNNILGCDTNKYGISLAREKTAGTEVKGLIYEAKTFLECEINDGSLDFVVLADVIEHLDDPKALLLEIKQKLRPGGKLILTTPYKKDIGSWDAYHVIEFTDKTLKNLLDEVFAKVEVRTFLPLFLYKIYYKFKLIRLSCNLLSFLGMNLFFLSGKKNVMLFAHATKG